MSKNNRIIKNYIYNTMYQLLVILAPLITTPYVSRVLGASGVGIYSYAQSIATYFVLVGAVGTTLYGQREIAYVQNDPKRRTEVFWEITIFRFVTVLACTIAFLWIFGFGDEYRIIYQILTLEVLATAFDISWFFMGMENFKVTVIRNTIIKLCGIVLVFLLVKEPDDVPVYTLCLTLPIFMGNISLWFNLKKHLVKIDFPRFSKIKKHIKPILVLFLPQIASEVYLVLDKTMIGQLGSSIDQVGYYTQAQKIVKIVLLVVTSLGTVMMPAMSAAFAQGKKDEMMKSIKNAFQFTFMIAFALLFGLIAVAERFVPIFFGPDYEPVTDLIIVISPILIIIGISTVIGRQYLLPTMQQGAYTASIVAGAAINFVLNMLLIPRYDALGASVATVLAELAVTGVQLWCVRKQIPLKMCVAPFVRYMALGAVMFLAVWGAGKWLPDGTLSLLVMIGIGGVVYLTELILTRDPLLKTGRQMILKKK